MNQVATIKRIRRPWVAVVLAILSPIISMLYLGRGKRALMYIVAAIVAAIITNFLQAIGFWPKGEFAQSVSLLNFVWLFGIFDSYEIAKKYGEEFHGAWYSYWYGVAGIGFGLLISIILFRSFLYEPFRIPSGSMMPTLMPGEYIFVNKYIYGLKIPLFNSVIVDVGTPERGDIIVFRSPQDPTIKYVFRVVGMPGDHVGYVNKILYINNNPMVQNVLGPYRDYEPSSSKAISEVREEYLSMAPHKILIRYGVDSINGEVFVPENHYFVLGDNRDASHDSRFWGFVPETNLIGKVALVWWSDQSLRRAWTHVE